jgi:CBS-domain-containing membrane protein
MPGRVSKVMTVEVVTVTPAAAFKRIAELLCRHDVSALPVVDQAGRVLGIVSQADLLQPQQYAPGTQLIAAKLMTAEVISVAPDATIAEAARLMERNAVKRLPVVGEDGVLVGIVSRSDVLHAFTRPDKDIHQEVVERIAEAILIVDPYRVDVSVSDGVVRLNGRVARHSQASLVGRLAGVVGGVLAVDNHLRFDLDDTRPRPATAGRRQAGKGQAGILRGDRVRTNVR